MRGSASTDASAGELGDVARWCAERLGDERLARVGRWPLTVELQVGGLGTALFCHATPRSDLPILTRITPDEDVARELGDIPAHVVVCGHTHVQYDRRVGSVRLVNAGSVGMPYEGSPDARWALLGPGGVELVATPYDAEAALDELSLTGFPLAEQWLAPVLRGEVTAEEATASFESRRVGA
jgi:diadenosine tetraphosphatase ApaH/serine/threonine PP2A family protein phosphatase